MFEYDHNKTLNNLEQPEINLEEATKLCNDPNRLVIPTQYVDEPRFVLIGSLNDKVWSAVYTVREQNTRIISVRRSRKNEEEIYFSR